MKTKLLWVIGSLGALSFASLQGCGDDDDPADSTGGTAGSTSGKGGTTSGKGGTTSGKGGTASGGDTGDSGGDTSSAGGTPGGGGDAAGGTPGGGGDVAVGGDTGAGGGGGDAEREAACDDYCVAYIDACADDDLNTYQNEADCITTCVASDWAIEGATGNTIQCREIHAGNAANAANADAIAMHCGHAADASTDICVD